MRCLKTSIARYIGAVGVVVCGWSIAVLICMDGRGVFAETAEKFGEWLESLLLYFLCILNASFFSKFGHN